MVGFSVTEGWTAHRFHCKNGLMILVHIIFSLFFSFQVHATEMVGALSAGMGGTGRAAIQSNESLYLNPASIALVDKFYSGASYQSGFLSEGISRNTYSINLTDGTADTMFPGSLGYRRHRISDYGQQYSEDEFKVGMGYRITQRMSLGLAGSYLKAVDEGQTIHKQTNLDLGFLVGLSPSWGVSLSGENLLKAKSDIPAALQRRAQAALGTQYIYKSYIITRYEVLLPLHTENTDELAHRFGLGFTLRGDFLLNLGYSVDDNVSQNWSSAGLAWMGPRLRLAYSFQKEERMGLGTRHLVDLWFDL